MASNSEGASVIADVVDSAGVVLLARQPIFDRDVQVIGYELLYRSDAVNQYQADSPGTQASARVIVNSLLNIGIDNLVGANRAFINVDRELLLSESLDALPPRRVVLEILETIAYSPELGDACAAARNKGFILALDDVDATNCASPFLGLVDIVKIDFCSASPSVRRQLAGRYSGAGGPTLLAEKVETAEQFDEAMSLGYQYFQGYFFARPSLLSGHSLSTNTISLLQILGQLASPDISSSSLEASVRQHVSLVHHLIRYANSAAFARRAPVQSVQHALALLGFDQLRRMLSLMVVADFNRSGPRELLVTALVRARMTEILAPKFGLQDRQGLLFLMGLFSLLDVMLKRPLADILNELHLDADLTDTLLGRCPGDHPVRRLHELVLAYENCNWTSLKKGAEEAGLSCKDLSNARLHAIQWADELSAV